MGMFVANKVVKLMIQNGITIKGANVLVMGVTFKENCPDIRNSKVVDIVNEFNEFDLQVDVFDPHVDENQVMKEYNIKIVRELKKYDAVVLAVSHNEFLTLDFQTLKKSSSSIIYDIKSVLERSQVTSRL